MALVGLRTTTDVISHEMLVLRGAPLQSKHNLKGCRDGLAVSETLGVSTIEAVFLATLKIILVSLSKKTQIPLRMQMSLAELMRSIIILLDGSLASKCMFAPPRFKSPFGNLSASFQDWMLSVQDTHP